MSPALAGGFFTTKATWEGLGWGIYKMSPDIVQEYKEVLEKEKRGMSKGHRSQHVKVQNDQILDNVNNKINNDSNGV